MPKRALTAVAVERIKPPAKGQVEIFDRGYPGFALRVSYGGGKAWSMFYRHGGKLRRLTLGLYPAMGLAEAREAWRATRKLVAMGQDPAQSTIKTGDTIDSVIEEWLKRDKRDAKASTLNQTSAPSIERCCRMERAPSSTISKRDVIELLDGIVDRGAPGKLEASMPICIGSSSGRWAGRSSKSARWMAWNVLSLPTVEIACCQMMSW